MKSRSQIGRMSRIKGRNYETHICHLLSDWSKDTFKRRGVGFSDKDILCPTWFPFSIECKKQEQVKAQDIIKSFPEGSLKAFWEQTKEQAAKENKSPLLIFSRNNEGVDYFITDNIKMLDIFTFANKPVAMVHGFDNNLYIVGLVQTLTTLDTEEFKKRIS